MKLSFVLTESALELVPKEIQRSPAVASDSRRREVDASRILLDRSLHHSAMARLRDSKKKGRPDLVHAALLSVTGTPLYLDGSVRIFVHTNQDVILELAEKTRIPKSYFRFRGLAEKLLSERSDEGLVKAYGAGIRELLRKTISPDRVFGLSVQGRQTGLEELAKAIVAAKSPCVIVGGFPHGHFSQETLGLVDELVRIHGRPLEAHVVAARIVYEVEKAAARTND
jgi:rRNA small subunit pseudouridine methyltransferase Nep1